MSKLVYQEPQDYFVEISICSLNSFVKLNPFSIELNVANINKIDKVLSKSTNSNFILFPEYTYSDILKDKYQNYSNEHGCIIIGGSGLEVIGDSYFAYAPIFIPNQEMIKVYKKHITNTETLYSSGKIIEYPNEVQREIRIENEDFDFIISVYVCYDFLVENKVDRSDIIFIPQFEKSPNQFIFEADKISKGFKNFVFGANNSDNNQRSLGFAILNGEIISALTDRGWRNEGYLDSNGDTMNQHRTIVYDINEEKNLIFKINLSKPFPLPYNFSLNGNRLNIIPTTEYVI